MGPGTVATWARATADQVDASGFKWEWAGRSSKHIPFDWSAGPKLNVFGSEEQPMSKRRIILVAVALVSLVIAVAGFVARDPRVVQAERIELVDGKGGVRAAFTTDTIGVSITLYDKRGRVSGSLQLNGEPRLTVRDGSGSEVAALGAPQVRHLVE